MDGNLPSDTTICETPHRPRAWDVVFYRARGAKAQVNLVAQCVLDPRLVMQKRRFTHCALVVTHEIAVEAYPRAVRGAVSGALHPPGVRLVPVSDLVSDDRSQLSALSLMRAPLSHGLEGEAQALARAMLGHRYGLRRFLGITGGRDGEWVTCADLVLRLLNGGGRLAPDRRRALGPGTLWSLLAAAGWRDIAADPAADPPESSFAEAAAAAPVKSFA